MTTNGHTSNICPRCHKPIEAEHVCSLDAEVEKLVAAGNESRKRRQRAGRAIGDVVEVWERAGMPRMELAEVLDGHAQRLRDAHEQERLAARKAKRGV